MKNFHVNTDAAESLAFVIFVLPIAVLAALFFLAMPIAGIVGGAQLIASNWQLASELFGVAALGCLISLLVGVYLLYDMLVEKFTPAPWDDEDAPDFCARLRRHRIGAILFGIAMILLIAIVALLVTAVIVYFTSNPLIAGCSAIAIGALSLGGTACAVIHILFY